MGLAVYPSHVGAAAYPQATLWAALVLCCLLAVVGSPRWQSGRAGAILAGCLAGVLVLLEPVLVLAAPVAAAVYWRGAGPPRGGDRTGRVALGRLLILAGVAAAIIGCWYGGKWLVAGAAGNSAAGGGQIGLQRLRDFLLSARRAGPARQAAWTASPRSPAWCSR